MVGAPKSHGRRWGRGLFLPHQPRADPDVSLGKLGREEGALCKALGVHCSPGWRSKVGGRRNPAPPIPKQNRKGPRGPIWQQRNMAAQREEAERGSGRQGLPNSLRSGEKVQRH